MATLNIDGFYFVRGARSICAATNVPTVGWFVKVVIGQPHNTEIRVPCSPAARESGAIRPFLEAATKPVIETLVADVAPEAPIDAPIAHVCTGLTKSGEDCKAKPKTGTDRCARHPR
jgi:hypothetical protein